MCITWLLYWEVEGMVLVLQGCQTCGHSASLCFSISNYETTIFDEEQWHFNNPQILKEESCIL